MNKKNLVKILNKEITILADFIDGFDKDGEVHPIEIDLTLSKVKDIYDELLLLKGEKNSKSLDEEVKQTTSVISDNIETVKSVNEFEKTDDKDIFEIMPENNESEKNINEVNVSQAESVDVKSDIDNTEKINQINENIEPEQKDTDKKEIEKEEPTQKNIYVEPEIIQESSNNKEVVENEETVEQQQKDKPEKKKIIADTFANKTPSINDMMARAKSNKDLASSLKNGPVKDLTKEIKLNDRIWYINELFSKNANSYENAVNTVNSANNLDEALEYLFSNFKWDQNRKSTISFLELVFRRFA